MPLFVNNIVIKANVRLFVYHSPTFAHISQILKLLLVYVHMNLLLLCDAHNADRSDTQVELAAVRSKVVRLQADNEELMAMIRVCTCI